MKKTFAPTGTYKGLSEIIQKLRSKEGCPWDREQTHISLRPNLIEEMYEALEAIDENNISGMTEELGDIIIQIVFHAQIAEENNTYTDKDIFTEAEKKLIRRHPHVFDNSPMPKTSQEVEINWDRLKKDEKKERKSILDGPSKLAPSLSYAQSIAQRAARAGFDWENELQVFEKLDEEINELQNAKNSEEIEHEIGDILLTITNIARWLSIDAESALRKANKRFYERFTFMESEIEKNDLDISQVNMITLSKLWEKAKEKLKSP
jgi:tetrapyrrole methylase family protein/MazG family protein